jgi:hypothetical protein
MAPSPSYLLMKATPTELLKKRYAKLAAEELRLRALSRASSPLYDIDEYDRAADLACIAARILESRGIEICDYCGEISPKAHIEPGCPWGAWVRREIGLGEALAQIKQLEATR